MKTLLGAACLLVLLAVACKEELPEAAAVEAGKESISFATDAGSTQVKIETSHGWTATASDAWLTVSPASGGSGASELTLSAVANSSTSPRQGTVMIQVGHTQTVIQVTQAQKEVLGLNRTSETVAWTAGSLHVIVSANVEGYQVASDATWLRESPLRSVKDSTLLFVYDENPSYDTRIAKVTVRKGDLNSVFTVTQGGKGALYFVLEEAEVPASDTQYALKLMKNTPASGLRIISGSDWVSLPTDTRAAPIEETVMLTLTPNQTTTPREAHLAISYDSDGMVLTDAFVLKQLGMERMIRPEQTAYAVKAEGATLTIPVEASGKFNVVVPEAAATWLTAPEGDQLPGSLHFTIAENKQPTPRTAAIVLRLQEGDELEATVTITQEAADLPAMDRIPKMYNLSEKYIVIETDPINLGAFKATVAYDEPGNTGWLTEIYTNSGKLHFVVNDNSGVSTAKRSATLHIVPEEGEAVDIRINQSGADEAYIELEKPGTLASFIDLSLKESYRNIRLVSAKGINESDLNTLRSVVLGVEKVDLRGIVGMTTLPAGAFKGSLTIRRVTLPNDLTAIGASAFEGCTALDVMLLEFPSTLITIGEKAFAGAFMSRPNAEVNDLNLSAVKALTTIGNNAFENCKNLTGLMLPVDGNLSTIGNSAFKNCTSLAGTLLLPSNLKSMGSEAFYNCRNLTGTLTVPATLTTVGAKAFMECASLEALDMSRSTLVTIEEETFRETGISSATLPVSLAKIGFGAFCLCKNLSSVTCRRVTPPVLDADKPEGTFDGSGLQEHRILYVPSAAVQTYKADASWTKATSDTGWTIKSIESTKM